MPITFWAKVLGESFVFGSTFCRLGWVGLGAGGCGQPAGLGWALGWLGAGLGWGWAWGLGAGGGWAGWAGWTLRGSPETEIGLFENGKVCIHRKK